MARDDPYFRLRIPESIKAQIEVAAVENKRSMTAEIIARLEGSFSSQGLDLDPDRVRAIVEIAVDEVLFGKAAVRERLERGAVHPQNPNEPSRKTLRRRARKQSGHDRGGA